MLPKILKVAKLLGLHEVAKMPKRAIQVKREEFSKTTQFQTSKVESFVLFFMLSLSLSLSSHYIWNLVVIL